MISVGLKSNEMTKIPFCMECGIVFFWEAEDSLCITGNSFEFNGITSGGDADFEAPSASWAVIFA